MSPEGDRTDSVPGLEGDSRERKGAYDRKAIIGPSSRGLNGEASQIGFLGP